ncbi:uncharacterized protein si:dkey-52l18.4 [Trichomycterus rosablanca]|uniref:uncharacterized protein si:dkey-52l18.4 n=1 Tax=Trichomycterus rosablanca TaxID=2290929 RepID=UPI002F34FD65
MSGIIIRLLLKIHNVNQSDSGLYQCIIKWQNSTSAGHVTQINVTAGRNEQFTAVSAGRITFYRLLVCAAASLCFPLLFIGLACCFSSNDTNAPPVPPHPRNNTSARVKPDTEVKYAMLVLNGRKHQNQAPAVEPTVYSTLNFSV